MKEKEKYVALIFIITIFLFLIGIVPTYIYRKGYINKQLKVNEFEILTSKHISWIDKYPFSLEDNKSISKLNLLNRYEEKIETLQTKITNLVNNYTLFRYPISEFYSHFQKILGIRIIKSIDSDVLVVDDKSLVFRGEYVDENPISDSINEFQEFLNDKKIDFLYVMAPYKCSSTNERNTYNGYLDYVCDNAERLSDSLIEKKLSFLNLQKVSIENNIHPSSMIFKYDHHWKPSYGLWATKMISEELNRRYEYFLDSSRYNFDYYEKVNYEKLFLGSQGKKATLAYAIAEDFEVIKPKYNTHLSVQIPSLNYSKEGDFYNTIFDQSQLISLRYPEKYYSLNPYSAYGYGDKPIINIHNYNENNGLKMLVIKDSFGDVTAPFLSLVFSDTSIVDLRHFTGSIKSYINDFSPNVVIVLMSGGSQQDIETNYNLHSNFYDFR